MTKPVAIGDMTAFGRILARSSIGGQPAYLIINSDGRMFMLSAIIVEGRN